MSNHIKDALEDARARLKGAGMYGGDEPIDKSLSQLTASPDREKVALQLPAIPDDDADFTPDLARKIIAKYQAILSTIAPEAAIRAGAFDFYAHLQRQREWSGKTFGPGDRAKGVVDHIRKELLEIEADPGDLKEWIDVVILALDGAWRSGATPDQIIAALVAKQTKNEARNWPDWRTADPDKAIEHVRDTAAIRSGGGE